MLSYKRDIILLILILFWIGISLSIKYLFLDNNILYYQTYGTQLPLSRIDRMLEFSRKWQWIGYAFMPVIILVRVLYSSVFLYIGVFFAEKNVEFGKIFKAALLADFVFVLSAFVKLIVLIFFKEISTLDDLQFQPLSIIELLGKNTIDQLFVYPLSLLNVFELTYFVVLAWLLNIIMNEKAPTGFRESLYLVTISYGAGLLLLVLMVMFLTLNIS